MWLSFPIVIGIVGGLIALVVGAAPVAVPLLVIGAIALGVRFFGRRAGGPVESRPDPSGRPMASTGARAGSETPQDDVTAGATHIETGYAHGGQAHMTPEQERTGG